MLVFVRNEKIFRFLKFFTHFRSNWVIFARFRSKWENFAFVFRDFTPSVKITHVFMTDRGVERPSVGEMKRLKNAKAKFLKPEYLAAYLIQDPINEKEFYVN